MTPEILSSPGAGSVEVFGHEVFGDQDVFDNHDLLVHDFVCFVADELSVSFYSFGRFTAGQSDRRDNHDQYYKHSLSHFQTP